MAGTQSGVNFDPSERGTFRIRSLPKSSDAQTPRRRSDPCSYALLDIFRASPRGHPWLDAPSPPFGQKADRVRAAPQPPENAASSADPHLHRYSPPVRGSNSEPVLDQGYQGVSGSIRNQDQGWGHQGSLISGSRVKSGSGQRPAPGSTWLTRIYSSGSFFFNSRVGQCQRAPEAPRSRQAGGRKTRSGTL